MTLGVALLVMAGASATSSVVVLSRANPNTVLPWVFGRAPRRPWQSQALAGLAGGSAVLGVFQLSDTLGYWGVPLALGMWVGGCAVQYWHNRHVTPHARG